MPRTAVAAALAALLLTAADPALADKAPDAAQIRQAAEHFDAGVAAFKQKDFEGAAARFEAADAAVPSAQALRQAIRARAEAGHASRAATLAAQAIARYPGDDQTLKLARGTLAKTERKLHKVSVSCASPCVLAIGTRSVPGEASPRWTLFLDPGKAALSASFSSGASSPKQDVDARAGGASEARFEPEAAPAPPPPPPPEKTPKTPENPGLPANDSTLSAPPPASPPPPRAGLPLPVFIGGAVVTAAFGGVTLWSGIDTITNPGRDLVLKKCGGTKNPSCPEYLLGVQKQARTNILIGATAGTAAITLMLGIFTSFRGDKKPQKGSVVAPTAAITDRDVVLGATGAF